MDEVAIIARYAVTKRFLHGSLGLRDGMPAFLAPPPWEEWRGDYGYRIGPVDHEFLHDWVMKEVFPGNVPWAPGPLTFFRIFKAIATAYDKAVRRTQLPGGSGVLIRHEFEPEDMDDANPLEDALPYEDLTLPSPELPQESENSRQVREVIAECWAEMQREEARKSADGGCRV